MVKELYVIKEKEISLNVTQSKIDSIKKKEVTKSGCRIYKDGYIGIAGTLGEATSDTWKKAEENLKNKVPYEFEPCKNMKRIRDLRVDNMSIEQFINVAEEFLKVLREEYSNFIFSNKIKLIEKEVTLKNDVGLDLKSIDRYFQTELMVKEKESINIIDTDLSGNARTFNKEDLLKLAKETLGNYTNMVSVPKEKKVPIIARPLELINKIVSELDGSKLGSGASIFNDKINKKVFSEKFTLYLDRSNENIMVPFFDSEGSTLEEDKLKLIDEGVIKLGYTDKRTADKYKVQNTAAASSEYDEVSSISQLSYNENIFSVNTSNKTLSEIIGDKDAIYVAEMAGGDCTNEGIFSSPVQSAYLVSGGKIVGRLPEFNIRGNIYDMFGKDYLGVSKEKYYTGENLVILNMEVTL
ncbi:MAG: hypothetical protein E7214_10485 [Clostridium sp.]|nr:hypothetical protein [Clostridium sp.]